MINIDKISDNYNTLILEQIISKIDTNNITIPELNQYIDDIINIDDNYIISNEGLVTKTIVSILDFIRSVIYSSIKNISRILIKVPKESVLSTYELNRTIRINRILHLSYTDIYNVLVQNPPLQMLPLDNIKYINKQHNSLNMIDVSNQYLSFLNEFSSMILTESYQDILDLKKIYKFNIKIGLSITKDITKNITIKIDNIPFGNLFKSMKEFNEYYSLIKDKNNIYTELDTVSKNMSITESNMNKLLDDIKDMKNITNVKKHVLCLKYLLQNSKAIAEDYEAYGLIVKIYSQIEYNLIQIFNTLSKKI